MNKQMTKVSETSSTSGNLDRSELAQRAQALESLARDLVSKLAKGTRDIPVIKESGRGRRATEYSMKGADIADQVEPTRDLYERVAAILETKPYLFRDLLAELGPNTNENRVKGILVRLQRDGRGLINLGNGARAIWWIDAKGRLAEIAASAARKIVSPKR